MTATISNQTKLLIERINKIGQQPEANDSEYVDVSRTVSFFAIAYEKVRNIIEFKDEHIVRRNAINRIIGRRLAFNTNLTDEALSLAKEIAWAGYYKKDKIPEKLIEKLGNVINWYIALRNQLIKGEAPQHAKYFAEFVKDLLVCQVEEMFTERDSEIDRSFLYYFYQVLNPAVKIDGLAEDSKNLIFYIGCDQVFLKSDKIYLRFNLFKLLFENLSTLKPESFPENAQEFKKSLRYIDKNVNRPLSRNITKYLKNIRPAYLVFRELVLTQPDKIVELIGDEKKFWSAVDSHCRDKYEMSKEKLKRAGVRSITYIFLTKVVFVLIAEYPIMKLLGEGVDYLTLGINALFPPFLMMLFVLLTSVPDEENTKRVFAKLTSVVYEDHLTVATFKNRKEKTKTPLFSIFFWIFYFTTFAITFFLIDSVLTLLNFHLTSKIIFFFFISAVSFFGYRIRQVAKEYVIKDKESVFTPVVDFFLIPLVSVGKWLSSEISKINVLLFVFDFLIEAPFKVLFEVIEEWISFVRKRKEDIV